MDEQLKTIIKTADSITKNLESNISIPKQSIEGSKDGISLLALKNHSMLSYLHNLALVTASHVARSQQDVTEVRQKAIQGTIKQRVTLEKGVKGLESKMAYQIEKVLRANFKAKQDADNIKAAANDSDSDSDDALTHRPNPNALMGNKYDKKKNGEDEEEEKMEIYQVPKIASVTPFGKDHAQKSSRRQQNSTMEEYLKHTSIAPIAEPSIGSTIMDHGRGGERTERDRKKQEEVNRYEEENFTRINQTSKKQDKRAARQRQRDAYGKNFFGEDWGLSNRGNTTNAIERITKRRDKPASVWERTKKRQKRG